MVMQLLLFPLFFLSPALFPAQNLPSWLSVLVRINPVSYGVDALRQVTLSSAEDGIHFRTHPLWPRYLCSRGYRTGGSLRDHHDYPGSVVLWNSGIVPLSTALKKTVATLSLGNQNFVAQLCFLLQSFQIPYGSTWEVT